MKLFAFLSLLGLCVSIPSSPMTTAPNHFPANECKSILIPAFFYHAHITYQLSFRHPGSTNTMTTKLMSSISTASRTYTVHSQLSSQPGNLLRRGISRASISMENQALASIPPSSSSAPCMHGNGSVPWSLSTSRTIFCTCTSSIGMLNMHSTSSTFTSSPWSTRMVCLPFSFRSHH